MHELVLKSLTLQKTISLKDILRSLSTYVMKFSLLLHTILNFKILQAEYTSYERKKKKNTIQRHDRCSEL